MGSGPVFPATSNTLSFRQGFLEHTTFLLSVGRQVFKMRMAGFPPPRKQNVIHIKAQKANVTLKSLVLLTSENTYWKACGRGSFRTSPNSNTVFH